MISLRLIARPAALAAALTLGLVTAARAVPLWTLTASPLTAIAGQSTTFSMLALNTFGPAAGCLTVDLGSSFVVQSVGTAVASDGSAWTATAVGSEVELTAVSGQDKLDTGESMAFSVRALPTAAGTWNWTNHIQITNQCNGAEYPGTPVVIVVAPAIVPTLPPTPVPTAVPTLPPIATPLPTLPPLPTLTPSPYPTATPASTAAPRPTSTATPAATGGTPGPTGGAGPVGRIAELDEGGIGSISLGAETFGLLDGQLVWFVPGAAVGVPGLLVLLWIALQTVGALAWVPAVRRMGGGDPVATRRRRRRPARV